MTRSIATAHLLSLMLLLAACRNDTPVSPPGSDVTSRASITSITPERAATCDFVTIRGRKLTGDSLSTRVLIGDQEVAPRSATDSSLVFQVPLTASSGAVRVIVGADTAVSPISLEVTRHPWSFRRVEFGLDGLLVRDTVVNPLSGVVAIDTFASAWSIDPDLDCASLTAPLFVYERYEDRSGGGSPNSTYWRITAVAFPSSTTFDSLHIIRQEFRYGGHLGSYRANLGIILRDVPFTREPDGTVIVAMQGRDLLDHVRIFDSYSGDPQSNRRTLELLANNPEARMTVRLIP